MTKSNPISKRSKASKPAKGGRACGTASGTFVLRGVVTAYEERFENGRLFSSAYVRFAEGGAIDGLRLPLPDGLRILPGRLNTLVKIMVLMK